VQASLSGLLTPRDAHRFKWNRFAGLQEGPGTRISRDLRLEQHNKIAKEDIRAMGVQNINDKSVEEFTKSEGSMEKIIIALFTVHFSHLHYNIIERECEAISGK